MKKALITLALVSLSALASCTSSANGKSLLGKSDSQISSHLQKAELSETKLFKGGRFPNIVTTPKGTVIGVFGKKEIIILEINAHALDSLRKLAFKVKGFLRSAPVGDIKAL